MILEYVVDSDKVKNLVLKIGKLKVVPVYHNDCNITFTLDPQTEVVITDTFIILDDTVIKVH